MHFLNETKLRASVATVPRTDRNCGRGHPREHHLLPPSLLKGNPKGWGDDSVSKAFALQA